jgi:hypothetical protein
MSTAVEFTVSIDCYTCRRQSTGCPATCIYRPVKVEVVANE